MADAISIQIPTALRPQVGDQAEVAIEGGTVGEVLGNLCGQHPELGKRLFKGEVSDGQLNRFVNVYVNDEDIRFMENLDTVLKSGDEVSIVPAIAGG